jgi:hypothetical protein
MRKRQQRAATALDVRIGYAADEAGRGVAYAVTGSAGDGAVVRVAFTVRRLPGLQGREVGYAALRGVARELAAAGHGSVRLLVDDEVLVADVGERRPLPSALTVPYVALRCAMNQFERVDVAVVPSAEITDLRTRALAEVSLRVAA